MTLPDGCLGALALELRPGARPARTALAQGDAGALADGMAQDLARLLPEASGLDLGLAAALFDPVELLRPGWPVHAALARLVAQAPAGDGQARVIAFGARGDALPPGLAPDPAYAGGPFVLLPFVLRGDGDVMARVGAEAERLLLERGMAGAGTALQAQDAFGVSIEHARYLTVHDLAAMTAMQYEHAGLGALWPVLETALFEPAREAVLDAPPEPPLRVRDGVARFDPIDAATWVAGPWGRVYSDPVQGFARFGMRQRQLAALLEAHGLRVEGP